MKINLIIEPAVATEAEIKKALNEYYGAKGSIEEVRNTLAGVTLDEIPHATAVRAVTGYLKSPDPGIAHALVGLATGPFAMARRPEEQQQSEETRKQKVSGE